MRFLFLILVFLAGFSMIHADDSIPKIKQKRDLPHKIGDVGTKYLKHLNKVDPNYIEQQKYNYTFMLQNTQNYEAYQLRSKSGHSIRFSPNPSLKMGPYFGWRWIFLGYTFDLNHLSKKENKTEFDLSIYSSTIGVDLYYKKSGENYKIRSVHLDDGINTRMLRDVSFSGFTTRLKGFNVYYIFNHRKFSYPAAFSQSTRQLRSCGSPLIGIGYLRHKLNLDAPLLEHVINTAIGYPEDESAVDSTMLFDEIRFSDYNISGGYAYNWVFAKNLLFASSLSVALAYKRSYGELDKNKINLRDFDFKNINVDGIGRFGLVWNNSRFYAGASTVIHVYRYQKSRFSMDNFFMNVNIYAGVNFGRKR